MCVCVWERERKRCICRFLSVFYSFSRGIIALSFFHHPFPKYTSIFCFRRARSKIPQEEYLHPWESTGGLAGSICPWAGWRDGRAGPWPGCLCLPSLLFLLTSSRPLATPWTSGPGRSLREFWNHSSYLFDFSFPKAKVRRRQTLAITGKEILDKDVTFQSCVNYLPFPWLKISFTVRKEERLKAEGRSN